MVHSYKLRAIKKECVHPTRLLDFRETKTLGDIVEPSYQILQRPAASPAKSKEELILPEQYNADGKEGEPVGEEENENGESCSKQNGIDKPEDKGDFTLANVLIGRDILTHDPHRSLLRYHKNKDLYNFVSNFKYADWKQIKRKVHQLALTLVSEQRSRIAKCQTVLDSRAIFHPNANQIRLEAKLQVELKRCLNYDSLEHSIISELFLVASGENIVPEEDLTTLSFKERASTISKMRGSFMLKNEQTLKAQEEDVNKLAEIKELYERTTEVPRQKEKSLISFEEFISMQNSPQILSIMQRSKGFNNEVQNEQLKPIEIEQFIKNRALGTNHHPVEFRIPRQTKPIGERVSGKQKIPNSPESARSACIEQDDNDSLPSFDSSLFSSIIYSDDSDEEIENLEASREELMINRRKSSINRRKSRKMTVIKRTKPSCERGTPSKGASLRTKMEKIFSSLEMPSSQKLKFLLKYSSKEHFISLQDVIRDWRSISKAVVLFERLLYFLIRKPKTASPDEAFTEQQEKLLQKSNCYISMAKMFGATTHAWLEAILKKFVIYVSNIIKYVEEKWKDVVTFRGHEYLKTRIRPILDCSENLNRELLQPLVPFGRGAAAELLA